jgi:hypothetical protein
MLLVFTAAAMGLALWWGKVALASRERVFRGKPESEWIKNLKYWDDPQVAEWRSYGEEGVQVLIRGLQRAYRPRERLYRNCYRPLPPLLQRFLPNPKQDSTRVRRMCLVSLLASLGTNALSATPVMIWTAREDESDTVRQGAISYFNSTEDDKSILNRLPRNQKDALLPALIRSVQDPGNWGLRNNAALSLQWYPERRDIVAPVLLGALKDPQPQVRLLAAEALNRVAPDIARKAGATSVLVAIAKNPDGQIAYRAVAGLGHAGSDPILAVPALVECLQSTNTLVAFQAVCVLARPPEDFISYSNTIISGLKSAAERKDNHAADARNALKRWIPNPAAKQEKK